MADFLKNYQKWEHLNVTQKKQTLGDCVKFYEEKALSYILANLPLEKQKSFKKQPVRLDFASAQIAGKDVNYGDNVVFVFSSKLIGSEKKSLFFEVGKNTIFAVFLSIFNNTANSPSKKTKFGELANGYFASITSEFGGKEQFQDDMMQEMSESLEQATEMTESK